MLGRVSMTSIALGNLTCAQLALASCLLHALDSKLVHDLTLSIRILTLSNTGFDCISDPTRH
jgi:hypothetical protein